MEQKKIWGLAWELQVEQTALLASPIYIGQAQWDRSQMYKRRKPRQIEASPLESAHPHAAMMFTSTVLGCLHSASTTWAFAELGFLCLASASRRAEAVSDRSNPSHGTRDVRRVCDLLGSVSLPELVRKDFSVRSWEEVPLFPSQISLLGFLWDSREDGGFEPPCHIALRLHLTLTSAGLEKLNL